MKIRTDFVTNSSSSSFSALLFGIDADKKVCYSLSGEYPDELYEAPITISGHLFDEPIEVGGNNYLESGLGRIESLEDLITVLQKIRRFNSFGYDEEDEYPAENDYEDEPEDHAGKGDIHQAEEIVLLIVEVGYGESDIGIYDSGSEEFEAIRSRFLNADAVWREEIIDETIHFFYDLPRWYTNSLAHDTEECLLFISEKSHEDEGKRRYFERLLQEGIEESSAYFYEIAFADPNPFSVKKIVRIASWEWIDETMIEELCERLRRMDGAQERPTEEAFEPTMRVPAVERKETSVSWSVRIEVLRTAVRDTVDSFLRQNHDVNELCDSLLNIEWENDPEWNSYILTANGGKERNVGIQSLLLFCITLKQITREVGLEIEADSGRKTWKITSEIGQIGLNYPWNE